MRLRPSAIAGIVAFLAGAAVLISVTLLMLAPSAETVRPSAAVGGPFALVDQDGAKVTETTYRGKPMLVFFGYTNCPDVCPTTLYEVSEVLNRLGDDARKVAPLFISIDPERDTPEVLRAYVSNFNPAIRALTGDQAAVDAAVKAYRAFAQKEPGEKPGEYSMNHTAVVYLMDKDGAFVAPFNLKRPDTEAAEELRRYL